ncbi:LysR family transcriptional regulator [Ochrobactrum grignonense]|nr:LysR family transcriptional regulator [Brucella grignonensis]
MWFGQRRRALGRTQPTVSAMLANLEGELGFELFERDKRRLVAKPEAYFFSNAPRKS